MVVLAVLAAPTAVGADPSCTDELTTRVQSELGVFTRWLEAHDVEGVIGEVGWPDDEGGAADRWNALADAWYRDADAADLWVMAWATGEWWGDYPLAVYEADGSGPVSQPNTQARVVESHLGSSGVLRGVNSAGGEFGTPGPLDATSAFSNHTPGTYGTSHHYDSSATFHYLATRGIEVVRLPFRWERVQPELGGPLDPEEMGQLRAAVDRATDAGLHVVLDVHNYGAYWRWDGSRGVRTPIGSDALSIDEFADLWRRLATHFIGTAGVVGYGLMNEPVGLPSIGGRSPAEVWEQAAQAAVTAIRQVDRTTTVLVGGYEWSGAQRWDAVHDDAWIDDPAGAIRYEAHHYFDRDNSGKYAHGYEAEVTDARARGYSIVCGRHNVERIAGPDRVATAVAAARRGWLAAEAIVVARSDDPSDALAGTVVAGSLDAPLVLTPTDGLAHEVAMLVRELGVERAVVMGGERALGRQVVADLEAAGVTRIDRLAGATRVETAAAAARAVPDAGRTALLVRGSFPTEPTRAWADALAASGLAAGRARSGAAWPVLVAGDTVPPATRETLDDLDIEHVIVVGGTATIPAGVDDDLRSAGYDVERLAGATRYDTSLEVVRRELALRGDAPSPLLIATGTAFPDGLSAGALAARLGGTLLLVPSQTDASQVAWLGDHRDRFTHTPLVVGGELAVAPAVAADIAAAVDG